MKTKRKRQSGFTLIELIVVIAIIMILAGMLIPRIQDTREAAKRSACATNMKTIIQSCNVYSTDVGVSPTANFTDYEGVAGNLYTTDLNPSTGESRGWTLSDLNVHICPKQTHHADVRAYIEQLRPTTFRTTLDPGSAVAAADVDYRIVPVGASTMPNFKNCIDGNIFLLETAIRHGQGRNVGYFNNVVKFLPDANLPNNIDPADGSAEGANEGTHAASFL